MTNYTEPATLIEVMKKRSNFTHKGITFISSASNEKFVSYQALYQNALGILYELQLKGIGSGSELVFQIDDNETFLYVFWACILGGIIAAPVTTGANDEFKLKLFKVMEVLHKPVLITTAKIAASLEKFAQDRDMISKFQEIKRHAIIVEDLRPDRGQGAIWNLRSDDIAFIQFSSGSTGDPKGVTLSHDNLVVNTNDNNAFLKTSPADSIISWLPLTHDLGLIAVHISGVAAGINQFLMPTSLFIKQPSLWIKKTHEHRATQLYSPNFGYKHLLTFWEHPSPQEAPDLSRVRVILNGAEPISVELCETFLEKFGVYGLNPFTMFAAYGLAEATVGVSGSPVGERLLTHCVNRYCLRVGQTVQDMAMGCPGSVVFADEGYRVSHCKLRICDDNGKVLSENTVGHIQLRGRSVTKGYYNNPEATRAVMTEDGWLITGDLGFMRHDRLVVTGREKDIIFVNGQNFYPHDIERLAETVAGIELGKVAACGVFNRKLQKEDILIFVQYKGNVAEFMPLSGAIKKYISGQLGLEIATVIPIRRIPKTTSGKIQRYRLGEAYQKGEFSNLLEEMERLEERALGLLAIEPPKTEKEKILARVLQEVLKVDAVSVERSFYEIGGNSINAVQIIDLLKEHHYSLNMETLVSPASIAVIAAQMNPYQAKTEEEFQESQWLNAVPPQRNFYLLNHRDLGRINWWILSVLLFSGKGFEKSAVEKVFQELIEYHPILKFKFAERKNELYMYSGPDYRPRASVDEVTIAAGADIETVLFHESTVMYQAINLTEGPLLKLKLCHTAKGDYLLICIHHFICDGASFVILIEDFATGYKQALQNQPIVFRKKTASFQQWVKTLYQYSKSPELLAELPFWSELEKYAMIPLPKDIPDGQNRYGDMEKAALVFTACDTKKLIAYSVQNNLKVEMLLSAAIGEAILNWSGRSGILIEHTFNARDCTLYGIDITRSVGWFSGSCPVLIDISKGKSVAEKLNAVKNSYLSIPDNGFGYLVLEQISCPQNTDLKSFTIHPEILLIYNGEYINESDRYGFDLPMIETGRWFDPELIRPNTFVIHSIIVNNQLKVSWEYSREQYQKTTIEQLLALMEDFIFKIINKPVATINAAFAADIIKSKETCPRRTIVEKNNAGVNS